MDCKDNLKNGYKTPGYYGLLRQLSGISQRKRIFLASQIIVAMYKFSFRFVVTTLTILTANLLTNAMSDYMITYKNHLRPITFTLVAMAVILVVFYPLFLKMNDWLKIISVKLISTGSSLAGKYLGLVLIFLGGLTVLLYFYAKMWYHIDFFKVLFHGNIRGYL